jgi:hypothetical protein
MNGGSVVRPRNLTLSATAAVVVAVVIVGIVGLSPLGVSRVEAATKKVATTKKRVTTRKATTTRRPVTTAPPVATTPASTIAPPIAASTTTAVTSLAATSLATASLATTAIVPTTIASSPVLFQQGVYAATVSAGGSTSSPIWLTIANGFNQPLTLRAINLPANITISFDQNPIRNYSVATISATSVAANGPAPIFELQAATASGTVVATTKVAVFVVNGTTGGGGGGGSSNPSGGDPNAAPDIAVSFSTSPVPVVRGGDVVSARIAIARQGGFSEAVDIYEVGTLPQGVIVSFENRRISGETAIVFLRAGATTPVGLFTVRLEIQTSKRRVPVELTFNVS